MPRYKVNCKVGPWRVGDVFESTDERSAALAAEGYLTELPEPGPPADDASADGEGPTAPSATGDQPDTYVGYAPPWRS